MEQPFAIVTTTAGAVSILCREVNEIMHNPVGPWAEANALYAVPSRLSEKLLEGGEDLVVYDVGLGAAANALAALTAARGLNQTAAGESKGPRRLHLISFERDLRLLEFALGHAAEFAHFHGFENAIRRLLDERVYEETGIRWELHEGEFLDKLDEVKPAPAHLIFFDPYSPKKNSDMWTAQAFAKLRSVCNEADGALMMTYSRATPIRVALLQAGFFVGAGAGTGLKDETTQAATKPQLLSKVLGKEFLDRWSRSQMQFPYGHSGQDLEALRTELEAHPQFNS